MLKSIELESRRRYYSTFQGESDRLAVTSPVQELRKQKENEISLVESKIVSLAKKYTVVVQNKNEGKLRYETSFWENGSDQLFTLHSIKKIGNQIAIHLTHIGIDVFPPSTPYDVAQYYLEDEMSLTFDSGNNRVISAQATTEQGLVSYNSNSFELSLDDKVDALTQILKKLEAFTTKDIQVLDYEAFMEPRRQQIRNSGALSATD